MDTLDIAALTEKAKNEYEHKQFAQAVADFQLCLDQMSSANNAPAIAEMRNNLSVALLRNGQAQAALEAVLGTDLDFAAAGDIQKQGIALANTASAYDALKLFNEAAAAYEQAVDCFKSCGEKQYLSICLHALANLQLKTGKQYHALATLQAAYNEKPQASLKDKFFASALGQILHKLFGI
jgi:tetratricopeptide (TPR) repeat protein